MCKAARLRQADPSCYTQSLLFLKNCILFLAPVLRKPPRWRMALSLPTATRLGPYEVIARVGEGGMGEVYRGRDTRLNRTVAIKVLRSHLSNNPEFRERFEREARAVST